MVCLIGNQHDFLLVKIIKGHTVFLCHPQFRMESLRGGKANIDSVLVCILKIVHPIDADVFAIKNNLIRKEIFCGCRIEEVLSRLLNDVREIDEEQEITISLLIEIEHQPSHDQRLAASRCHMEKHLGRLRAIAALKMRNKVFKRLFLIRAQLKV